MLEDSFARQHDYLRISLTDACNLRCTYCMPVENMQFMPNDHLMQPDEILAIATEFVRLGVKKIRLTGGEPLVRKDADGIIRLLSDLPVELTLTTNGARIHEFTDLFRTAGIRSVNVSLDTLDPEKFKRITRRDLFQRVFQNIQLLVSEGFHVKVNAVIMNGVNEDEILPFVEWTRENPVHVRFIEFMPFSGNQWENEQVYPLHRMLEQIGSRYPFVKLGDHPNDTAKKFTVPGHLGTFAVISTMSAPFCSTCNRLRLTADGKMKNCLFSRTETDLLSALRNGKELRPLIEQCLAGKAEALGGQFTPDYESIEAEKIHNRSMIQIGG